jgi:hypothetical protein
LETVIVDGQNLDQKSLLQMPAAKIRYSKKDTRKIRAIRKQTNDHIGEMFRLFGEAFSIIFDDPVLKEKAIQLGVDAAESMKNCSARFQGSTK